MSESEPTNIPDIDPTDIPSNEVVTVPRCCFKPCVQLQHDIDVALQSCADDAKSRYLVAIDLCYIICYTSHDLCIYQVTYGYIT